MGPSPKIHETRDILLTCEFASNAARYAAT